MERNLSVECRPQTLSDFIGCQDVIDPIKEGFKQGRIDSTYILTGPPGTGKTSLARAIIKHVNSKLDYYDITEPDTADLDADTLRHLITQARYSPQWGDYKGIIIDEAQKIRADVQSILLKATEEPCPSTVWFICSSEPDKLVPALRRRGSFYTLSGLSLEDTKILINKVVLHVGASSVEGLKNQDLLAEALAKNEVTSPGLIIRGVEKWLAGVPIEVAAQVSEVTAVNTFAIAQAVAAGDWKETQKHIQIAPASAARDVRGKIASYFRAILVKQPAGSKRAERCVWAIQQMAELSNQNQYEDGLIWATTCASIYNICVGQQQYIAAKAPSPLRKA